jgi:MFS family permease
LFKNRDFSGANLLTLLLYAGLGGSLYFLPFNLVQVQGYSATAAGSAFLPFIFVTFVMSRWAGGLVTRYGARLPLVVGPVIAAVGFLLFARPGIGGSYWTTFFPAILIMGLGMSLVIAPLTTTALNSVEGEHSGLASGVNNAVSRLASLVSIPILGILVFAVFSGSLDARVAGLDLSPEARGQLEAEKADLAGAQAPEGLSEGDAAAVDRAVDEAFVGGFRVIMLVAAGLAIASSVAAAVMISGRKRPGPEPTPESPKPAPA